jgi:uncharacterized paraquat-inducible protein A
MAKCSKCDFKYATQDKCPNCGAEDPVSTSEEISKILNRIFITALILFICFIIWPTEVSKVLGAFSILINEFIKGFGG